MKKNWIVAGFCMAAVIAGGIAARRASAAPKAEADTRELMKRKLQHAEAILAGLTFEDFDKIKKAGGELLLLSQEAQWMKHQSPKYNELSQSFRSSVEKMNKMAEEKNLEGATLDYMQVVMSCVECHKLVRGGTKLAGAK